MKTMNVYVILDADGDIVDSGEYGHFTEEYDEAKEHLDYLVSCCDMEESEEDLSIHLANLIIHPEPMAQT